MTTIGNILLVIATLIFFASLSIVLGKTAPRGGDAVMGYAWGTIILTAGFLICMILITFIIGWKGALNWVSSNPSARFFLIASCVLVTVITTGLCSLFKYENGPVPALIRVFSGFVPVLIPLVLLLAAGILLNDHWRNMVPVALYKWPLLIIFITGLAGVTAAAKGFMDENKHNQQARAEQMVEDNDNNHQRMLQEIDSCDVTKNMVFLLVFTDANQHQEVREKAVAKVKTNPQWQQELISRLKNDWAPEAFNFLASNAVPDPQLFGEPAKEGVLIQAKLIRESIRKSSHPSHFYAGQFSWEVERVLRTVDKFSSTGIDYRSAILQLRAALNEPSDFEKPAFQCTAMLDDWIKKHP